MRCSTGRCSVLDHGTWTSTAHGSVEGLNFELPTSILLHLTNLRIALSAHLFSLLNNEDRTDEKEQGVADFLSWMRENSLDWAGAGQIVASKEVFESEEYQQYPQSFFTSSDVEKEASYIFDYKYYSYVESALVLFYPI